MLSQVLSLSSDAQGWFGFLLRTSLASYAGLVLVDPHRSGTNHTCIFVTLKTHHKQAFLKNIKTHCRRLWVDLVIYIFCGCGLGSDKPVVAGIHYYPYLLSIFLFFYDNILTTIFLSSLGY